MPVAVQEDQDLNNIVEICKSNDIHLIRFLYCDTSSMIRGKCAHISSLKERIESGIGLVKGMMAMNMFDQMQLSTGFGAVGEVRLVPDLSTFQVLPYARQHAAMICDLKELDQSAWELCPRSLLKRQVERARQSGLAFQAAFEPEFMLGREDNGQFKPLDESVCFSTEGMATGYAFISDFVQALELQNLEIAQYYPENGHGQHELSVMHGPPLRAADQHIVYRETLRGIAQKQGVVASLAPKPLADQAGNGCHLHFSIWDTNSGQNILLSKNDLSETGRHFIAGILRHLSGLAALTCSSVNSYRRLKPRSWSSAYRCWGWENREAAIRVPSLYWQHEDTSANIEIKCVDASCNPYLALAAVIAAGLDGIEQQHALPAPVSVDPSTLSDTERARGEIDRLPTCLEDSLSHLQNDQTLIGALGEKMVKTFIEVKRSEIQHLSGKTAEEELRAHRTKF